MTVDNLQNFTSVNNAKMTRNTKNIFSNKEKSFIYAANISKIIQDIEKNEAKIGKNRLRIRKIQEKFAGV